MIDAFRKFSQFVGGINTVVNFACLPVEIARVRIKQNICSEASVENIAADNL